MAAIIAQITRQNRERQKKKHYETSKCMYELPPFDPHFDPKKHNKYMARREEYKIKEEAQKKIKEAMEAQRKASRQRQKNVPFNLKTCLIESCIIVGMLSVVPILLMAVELFFKMNAPPAT